jgi:hypothetical protein
MSKDHQKNILFVKALVDTQPVARRIQIYRWLCDLAGDPWTTQQLATLADELEAAERRSREFDRALSQKHSV